MSKKFTAISSNNKKPDAKIGHRVLCESTFVVNYFTRLRYSPVRVSISILSPVSTKAGTESS